MYLLAIGTYEFKLKINKIVPIYEFYIGILTLTVAVESTIRTALPRGCKYTCVC